MDIEFIARALSVLLKGLSMTLILAGCAIVAGFAFGLTLALMHMSQRRLVAGFARGYSVVFRGTPFLVQIFLLYYGLAQLSFIKNNAVMWWFIGDATHCAILALSLNTAGYSSEILRGGFVAVPTGVLEAARACGMSRLLQFRRILFPLAMRQALPAYGNELILIVKGTSLASTITVLEITGYAKRLMSQTYAIFEIFAVAGLLYLLINLVVVSLVRLIERALAVPT